MNSVEVDLAALDSTKSTDSIRMRFSYRYLLGTKPACVLYRVKGWAEIMLVRVSLTLPRNSLKPRVTIHEIFSSAVYVGASNVDAKRIQLRTVGHCSNVGSIRSGANIWINPPVGPFSGRLGWLFRVADAAWGAHGPAFTVFLAATLLFVIGCLPWLRAATRSALDRRPS